MKNNANLTISLTCNRLYVFLIISAITLTAFQKAVIAQNKIDSPLSVSKVNPRYFADANGNIVYLTGSHTWATLVDISPSDPSASIDFNVYLNWMKQYNHNFLRLWTMESLKWHSTNPDNLDKIYTIYPHPWKRTGPELAFDGKPKFNLDEFDEKYFNRLKTRLDSAKKHGIYVSVMLFEGFEMQFVKNAWKNHPFHPDNNINSINAYLNEDGNGLELYTLSSPEALTIQEKYVRHLIDVLNGFDNLLYEISNETHPASTQWQYHLINLIHEYEKNKPKQHPVGMTFQYKGGSNDTLLASPAEWISTSPPVGMFDNPPVSDGDKVIIYDTDHIWGIGGNRQWVWKTFTRGMYPIFMDPYDGVFLGKPMDTKFEPVRKNMGYTRIYAEKMDLSKTVPSGDLSSTNYCLANPGYEYLIYQPASDTVFSVNLEKGKYKYEWFNPGSGQVKESGKVKVVKGSILFKAPFSGDAVLYLKH
ncbi:MAG: hypothetical protein A2W90_13460 [Bacteroidetes bacterium GWF2_42_66]|nr:MAG: hypothetical protein A2W92_14175 [Bacteroidetes bacterium GWA2_42_15]OFX97271.1 MAG: hypothetical protein A2W89_00635 [Bacteroidetes bacterium GWE2_42_39]OFY39908.1 MAG: hypothetical protein A2W90_13460 [Bacteroidetes bacterium GWF2_42_66]HBL78089.1 hypothetical protein [Prolixibacteraceae bacterium]HCR90386.1 hypothetical protein [Prolixibacteraceae bacterium]